ncbi:MAG: hypothetical protein J0M25_13015 [Flavobacteriales bacterium]|nr:hypothetical protein [Flavobacteriales bacterium]
MDPKQIYIAANHMSRQVKWELVNGDEWFFVGANEEFNVEEFQKIATGFFGEMPLYIVIDRNNVIESTCYELSDELAKIPRDIDILITSQNHRKIIQINKIGVARKGNYEN